MAEGSMHTDDADDVRLSYPSVNSQSHNCPGSAIELEIHLRSCTDHISNCGDFEKAYSNKLGHSTLQWPCSCFLY